MDWIFVLLAGISGLLFTGGDVFLKYWANASKPHNLIIGFLFYIAAGTILALSFKRKEIAVAVAVLVCFNLITVAILGLTIFKETIGLKEMIGISLAAVAIIIFNV
jgi:multidrug transporter EmrE-like cation transporter